MEATKAAPRHRDGRQGMDLQQTADVDALGLLER